MEVIHAYRNSERHMRFLKEKTIITQIIWHIDYRKCIFFEHNNHSRIFLCQLNYYLIFFPQLSFLTPQTHHCKIWQWYRITSFSFFSWCLSLQRGEKKNKRQRRKTQNIAMLRKPNPKIVLTWFFFPYLNANTLSCWNIHFPFQRQLLTVHSCAPPLNCQ